MTQKLVSVIIPAYNAAHSIVATLRSACAQTHRALQIIVVDDGSTDDTAEIVDKLARRDPRIRLERQPNGGVARARNRGIDAAEGAFIAPLDADDIWSPIKIERQLAALDAAGSRAALAYGWFRRIDTQDRVMPVSPHPILSGRVFHRHLEWNFISNGSTPLIRADVARAIRYDPALHDAGNQGCEDYLFQLRIAQTHEFVCVPAFVTGYRQGAGSMSAGVGRMIMSHLQMFAMLYPTADAVQRRLISRRSATLLTELARNRARSGAALASARAVAAAVHRDPVAAGQALLVELRNATQRRVIAAPLGAEFLAWDPALADGDWATRRSPKLLAKLAALDAR
jgi:glycosyltransferase involved in cell wall biosynthesis